VAGSTLAIELNCGGMHNAHVLVSNGGDIYMAANRALIRVFEVIDSEMFTSFGIIIKSTPPFPQFEVWRMHGSVPQSLWELEKYLGWDRQRRYPDTASFGNGRILRVALVPKPVKQEHVFIRADMLVGGREFSGRSGFSIAISKHVAAQVEIEEGILHGSNLKLDERVLPTTKASTTRLNRDQAGTSTWG
jgi:hypothetical protein